MAAIASNAARLLPAAESPDQQHEQVSRQPFALSGVSIPRQVGRDMLTGPLPAVCLDSSRAAFGDKVTLGSVQLMAGTGCPRAPDSPH